MKLNYLLLLSVFVFTNGRAMESAGKYNKSPPPPTFNEEKKVSPDVILITADRPAWAMGDVDTNNDVETNDDMETNDVDSGEAITAGDVAKAVVGAVVVVGVTIGRIVLAGGALLGK
jgi:hypothetical protein